MQLRLLGTAAGGGFPQWNCWCPACCAARDTPARATPRSQSSLGISANGTRWFLCSASPDVREQIATLPPPAAQGLRRSPVEAVILTDAELDHTLGLALLREAGRLHLYATRAVMNILERDSRLLPLLRAFAEVRLTELPLEEPVPLELADGSDSGLTVQAFAVEGHPPRFASVDEVGHACGLLIRDGSGGCSAYVPGCGAVTEDLLTRLEEADVILFDGTCWSDDELIALGLGQRRAREMGHVPLSGPGGSLAALARLDERRRVLTHINNTNPILLEDSPERAAVAAAGWTVGEDGLAITLESALRAAR